MRHVAIHLLIGVAKSLAALVHGQGWKLFRCERTQTRDLLCKCHQDMHAAKHNTAHATPIIQLGASLYSARQHTCSSHAGSGAGHCAAALNTSLYT